MNQKTKCQLSSEFKIFVVSFFSMLLILLPNIIINNGLFVNTCDYSYQQIPFYYHVSEYIKVFGVGWDWYTDLGTDLIPSYSFYLTGSIFFWILSFLSGHVIIYVMPIMIAFKTAVGALGAFAYIKRYVKNNNAIFIGAFMYAFSGFQISSLIYNHFHDVTALFPFLLFAFDRLVYENKKCFFAFMVGLMALTNYFFFIGIVFFGLIYYIVKCISKEFKFDSKNFIQILIESVVGVGIAAIILVPTYLLISSADRVDDKLYGVALLSYSDNTIIPKLFQSFFMIPDSLGIGTLFKSVYNQNGCSSLSLYLPFFTITGVLTFVKRNRYNWISVSLIVFLFIAVVPGLNSIFTLFNESYYARWLFMPVLLMCLATSRALEEDYDLIFGIKFVTVSTVILALLACLPNKVAKNKETATLEIGQTLYPEKEIRWFSMCETPAVFWQYIAFAVICILLLFVYEHEKSKDDKALKKITIAMITFVILTSAVYINNTTELTSIDSKTYLATAINYKPELDKDEAYRITHVNDSNPNNFGMVWGYMNAGCFHSIEPNESDDFFYNVKGRRRLMESDYPKSDDYPVYGLLSIKYLFNASTNDDLNIEIKQANLTGCSLYDKQGGYYIYKNDNFIPFGFMYDYGIDSDTLENYLDTNNKSNRYQYKQLAMLRALVLDDTDIEKYSEYIDPLPEEMLDGLDENSYSLDCSDRKAESCSSFEYDSKGYRAEITTDRKGLVYFSVPCSNGWTATVNGKDVDVIKAHYGLTAIPVEAGENKIECSYETPGLKEGKNITFISVFIFFLYMLICLLSENKKNTSQRQKSLVDSIDG